MIDRDSGRLLQVVNHNVDGYQYVVAGELRNLEVRDPATGTVLRRDGPDHLGLWCDALLEHQMALITSGCAAFRCWPTSATCSRRTRTC